MKKYWIYLLLLISFGLSGCYTQFASAYDYYPEESSPEEAPEEIVYEPYENTAPEQEFYGEESYYYEGERLTKSESYYDENGDLVVVNNYYTDLRPNYRRYFWGYHPSTTIYVNFDPFFDPWWNSYYFSRPFWYRYRHYNPWWVCNPFTPYGYFDSYYSGWNDWWYPYSPVYYGSSGTYVYNGKDRNHGNAGRYRDTYGGRGGIGGRSSGTGYINESNPTVGRGVIIADDNRSDDLGIPVKNTDKENRIPVIDRDSEGRIGTVGGTVIPGNKNKYIPKNDDTGVIENKTKSRNLADEQKTPQNGGAIPPKVNDKAKVDIESSKEIKNRYTPEPKKSERNNSQRKYYVPKSNTKSNSGEYKNDTNKNNSRKTYKSPAKKTERKTYTPTKRTYTPPKSTNSSPSYSAPKSNSSSRSYTAPKSSSPSRSSSSSSNNSSSSRGSSGSRNSRK